MMEKKLSKKERKALKERLLKDKKKAIKDSNNVILK